MNEKLSIMSYFGIAWICFGIAWLVVFYLANHTAVGCAGSYNTLAESVLARTGGLMHSRSRTNRAGRTKIKRLI